MKAAVLFPSILFFFLSKAVSAQYTITGLKGMVSVPHAEVMDDASFMIGVQSNDHKYFLHNGKTSTSDEKIYSINIGFINRLNVIINLTRVNNSKDSLGIGDRDGQITYLIKKESKWLPSIVINMSFPDISGQQYLSGNHLVITKSLNYSKNWNTKTTIGYGIPYLFGGTENETNSFIIEKESSFLTGIFGGCELVYKKNSSLHLEYDGRSWNAGIAKILWKRLSFDLMLQGFSRLEFGLNYHATIR